MYALVRTDIPLANQLVQVAHACLEAGHRGPFPARHPHLILLSVENEAALKCAVRCWRSAGITVHVFTEPDFPRGSNAACTAPVSATGRRQFRSFPLWTGK